MPCFGVDIRVLEEDVNDQPNRQGGENTNIQTQDTRTDEEQATKNWVFKIIEVINGLG
jgi:hypothetical protein